MPAEFEVEYKGVTGGCLKGWCMGRGLLGKPLQSYLSVLAGVGAYLITVSGSSAN